MDEVRLQGRALHSGREARVTLARTEGPLVVEVDGARALARSLEPACGDHASVWLRGGVPFLATIEHLLAALCAAGVTGGLEVRVEGEASAPELPLLDGGARAWLEALEALGLVREGPHEASRRVVREAELEVGASRYLFTPQRGLALEVEVELGPRVTPRAAWGGSAADFAERIAPARTFALARDVEGLADRGLALGAIKESVVVITDGGLLSAGSPAGADEPARHKLLDLVGDVYAYTWGLEGRVVARRPGHAATHEIMRRALEAGVIA